MSSFTTPYNELTIIAYGPIPAPAGRPDIVNMIFRHGDTLLFAPYRLTGDGVEGAAVEPLDALTPLIDTNAFAQLNTPISPQIDFLLWIDAEGTPRYSHRDEVFRELQGQSEKLMVEAREALRHNRLDTAANLATQAIRADEENMDARIILAAIYRLRGQESLAKHLHESAEALIPGFPFSHHVDRLLKDCAPSNGSGDDAGSTSRNIFHKLGTVKPQAA